MKTIDVGGPYEKLFRPQNNASTIESKFVQSADFFSGLKDLINVVGLAQQDGKRVRAYGSKWSINDMAYSDEYLVTTWGLNFCRIGVDDEVDLTENYGKKKNQLVFVQSGVMVRDLNKELIEKGLALSTTGAGDGQRIAGAVSTGTHGSAHGFGSMQEYVKGIHLVVPGKHVFLQRSSDPVVTTSFARSINNAILIDDDDLFDAALVSFGSFGLIHAYLLEAEPLYLLKMQSKEMSYDSVRTVIQSMDVSSLGFQGVDELPFHFEVTLNPYRLHRSKSGAFVRVFQKLPVDDMGNTISRALAERPQGYDLFDRMGFAFGGSTAPIGLYAKRFIYGMGIDLSVKSFFQTKVRRPLIKTAPEFFTGKTMSLPETQTTISGTGMEIGVPLDRVQDALDIILKILSRDPIPTPVAIRYVKKSRATLAFTKYGDITATIELPGPYGTDTFTDTGRVFEKISAALVDIPHSYHWGQHFPLNSEWVLRSYGSDLEKWQRQRALLLDEGGRDIFSNDVLEVLGIHS